MFQHMKKAVKWYFEHYAVYYTPVEMTKENHK